MNDLPKPKPYSLWGFIVVVVKAILTRQEWIDIFFLKCDAKGCNYQAYYQYPHADLIDEPCPKCGANLCTAQDMIDWVDEQLSKS